MAAFRRYMPALALLLLVFSATAAFAQQNPALQCVANAGVPPLLRSEGITDLTGDIVLNCTGGTPTPVGSPIPQTNVQVFLNTSVTSRLLSGSVLESILMIDEPGTTSNPVQSMCPNTTGCTWNGNAGALGAADYNGQVLCQYTVTASGAVTFGSAAFGSACAAAPTGSTLATIGPRYNMYQGQLSGNQSVLFLGVPIDPPGSTGVRVVRITNIRANSSAVAPGGSGTPGQVLALVSASPQNILPINNPQQIVGYVQRGLNFSVAQVGTPGNNQGNQTLAQCSSLNTTTSSTRNGTFLLRFSEGFATAFKTRTASFDTAGLTSPAPDATTILHHSVPGDITTDPRPTATGPYPANITAATESGFMTASNANLTGATYYSNAGLADFGTRLQAVFNNIPNGVNLFVTTNQLSATGYSTGTAKAVLIQSDSAPFLGQTATTSGTANYNYTTANGNVAVSQLTVTNGTATATWEVTAESALAIEDLFFGVTASYSANPQSNSPAINIQSTVNGRFAPISTVTVASLAGTPIPRFVDTSSAINTFVIRRCQTNLLFPFVTNSPGFDSGIEISNTSKDPFGTNPQTGACMLNFYGDNAPSAPVSINGTSSAGVATPIPAGSYAAVTLSTAAPNFTGYIIAVCDFQYAHGFAFISDIGVRNFAEGYVALVIGDGRGTPVNIPQSGTGLGSAEVLGQ